MQRRIREIVIVYTVPGDDTLREMRIENTEGQVIDGIIWSRTLVERLRYAAGSQCVPPRVGPGTKPWHVKRQPAGTTDESTVERMATAESGDNCVWLHEEDCSWESYCDS